MGQGQGQAEALFTPVKLSDRMYRYPSVSGGQWPFGEYIKVACGGKNREVLLW